jgi:hypothetical protein
MDAELPSELVMEIARVVAESAGGSPRFEDPSLTEMEP